MSFHKIAHKLGISVGTAFNRAKSPENSEILKSYTAIVDSSKVGYSQTAIILGQAEGKHLLAVEKEVARKNNVISVYDIAGYFNFM